MDFLKEFESIGDNCEFGMIQKLYGFDEGSLLKWARIPKIYQLINFLENDFKEFYLLDNISPKWDDMIEDTKYGLWFHSDLGSVMSENVRRWTLDDADARKQIYEVEYEKRTYLLKKFKNAIAENGKIFVYKMNALVEPSAIVRLHAALRRHGKANLLHVEQAAEGEACYRVAERGDGLWRSCLPRFAPYWPVTDYLPGAWEELCEEAYAAIRRSR